MDHKANIAYHLNKVSEMAASAEECRAKLRTAVALQDDHETEFYTARVEFYVGVEKQFLANADMYARKLAEKEAASTPASDQGVILVQPETVGATLDHLDDLIEELREEADAVANRDSGEWNIREAIDAAQLGKVLLVQAVEMDVPDMAQSVIAMFEEVEA
jgi:hypothetical protein